MHSDATPADWADNVGEELRKTYRRFQQDGFFAKYFAGPNILDIGYKGYVDHVHPVFPHAIGVELDYPGYDGRTLPFADESQDTVFASHTLEHIPDYRQAISEWHRVLRIGGHMVIAVPHQYLYERKASLPSRYNGDHRRLYTAASLMLEVEEALDPMSYRIRLLEDNDADFDYSIPPERHAGGCYELLMVLQRIRRPDYADAVLSTQIAGPPAGSWQQKAKLNDRETLVVIEGDGRTVQRVLVLKLDHRGDFITARPAFAALRQRFSQAHLTLACGSWNEVEARTSGLFQEIIVADFFPEVASRTHEGFDQSAAVARAVKALGGKSWDLAIDLRVDRDTRHVLAQVDTTHRAGFGQPGEFPFLDVFLPFMNPTIEGRAYRRLLRPDKFTTLIGRHEGYAIINDGGGSARGAGEFLVFGPYEPFEQGKWHVELMIEPQGEPFDIAFDVCGNAGAQVLAFGRLRIDGAGGCSFALELEEAVHDIEIRLIVAATGPVPAFRFMGAKAYTKGTMSGLHQQEMQVLLATLVGLRMTNPVSSREIEA